MKTVKGKLSKDILSGDMVLGKNTIFLHKKGKLISTVLQ